MFFQSLSFMALYGSAMNQPGNIIPHSRDLGVGSAWQTFCSSPVEETSALNQPGNITPHSNARCSIRHLGLGLGGQNFRYNLMEKIVNVANPSPVRVPQRGMVYFSRIALCENTQKQIGNNTHPSRALRHLGASLYWSPLNQPGNITPHSNARCSLRHLGLGLGGQTFCSNPMEKIENVANPSLVRVPQREMVYFSNVECWYHTFISLFMLGF